MRTEEKVGGANLRSAPIVAAIGSSEAHFFFFNGAFFFVSTFAVFFGAHFPQDIFEPPPGFYPEVDMIVLSISILLGLASDCNDLLDPIRYLLNSAVNLH